MTEGAALGVGASPISIVDRRPDHDVVALLEQLLARAKAGDIQAIALVTEDSGRCTGSAIAGDCNAFQMLGALRMLEHRMMAEKVELP